MSEVLDVAKKDGRWTECPSCSEIIITEKLRENLWVCPHCNFHFRLGAKERIEMVCDEGTFDAIAAGDPAETETLPITGGSARIGGQPCVIGVMDFSVRGGTMDVAVASVVIRLMKLSAREKVPFVMFCSSGGVRVQDGIFGLMQMLRTAHMRNISDASFMITVFTDPTFGGVTASFATLADIMIAEPGCRIGFAGPRVIASTVNYELPSDFQKAATLLKNGFLDAIVPRDQLREKLTYILKWL